MPKPRRRPRTANTKVERILRSVQRRRQALGAFLASLLLVAAAFTIWSCQAGSSRVSDRVNLGFFEEPDVRVRLKKSAEALTVGGPPRLIVRALGVTRNKMRTLLKRHGLLADTADGALPRSIAG